MREIAVTTGLLLVLMTCPSNGSETDEVLQRAIELHDRIAYSKDAVERYGRGHVIVGRVVVDEGDDPAMVHAQMLILPDGTFAGPIRDLVSPVGFRMHQYSPFDLKLEGRTGEVINVGVIRMRRLPKQKLVPIKGKIILEGTDDASRASVSLSASKGPINTPSNGTNPRPRWPRPVQVSVAPSGQVHGTGFSPMAYYCSITAPGFVAREMKVDFHPKVGADIGTVTLEKPRQVTIRYIVAENDAFDLESVQNTILTGGARWKVDPDSSRWDVELTQQNGELILDHFYSPCTIADLGVTSLRRSLKTSPSAAHQTARGTVLTEGHVYLLNQQHLRHLVLFKVRRIR